MTWIGDRMGAVGGEQARPALLINKPKKLVWSTYQEAVYHDVEFGEGHTIVQAVAGSGKSTTLVQALTYTYDTESAIVLAFSKPVQRELERRVPAGVEAATSHSLGLRAIRQACGPVTVKEDRVMSFLKKLLPGQKDLGDLARVVGLAKNTAATSRDEINELMAQVGVDFGAPPSNSSAVSKRERELADVVISVLQKCQNLSGFVDFDDMIWLPVVHDMPPAFRYDRVMVDETQDLNPLQLRQVQKLVRKGGRALMVGDRYQCIPAGGMISTPDGQVPIESVRRGDTVLAVKAGRTVEARVSHKSSVIKEEAFEFDLGKYGTVRATAEHIMFAAIDDPRGVFVYLMYRHGYGYRIGVTRTVGHRGDHFIIRTQQEQADRIWVLSWHETYSKGAEQEAHWAYQYGIPREPFTPRGDMWSDAEGTARLFAVFGANGARLLDDLGFDFDRPNYVPKGRYNASRVAVNLLMSTKDGHRVEVETTVRNKRRARALGMLPTHRGTHRLRKCFRSLRDARALAKKLSRALGGYVIESLANTSNSRRMLAVPAGSVNIGMAVPVVVNGKVCTVPVLGRKKILVHKCYDLEIEDHGNFIVDNVVVHNSIFQFRGADENAMDNLKNAFDAKELPLSVCYRCGTKIVEEARKLVPHIESPPGQHDGVVLDEVESALISRTQPNDLIVSRYNSPMVRICYKLLLAGKSAHIMGRDVGHGIRKLIKQLKPDDIADLRRKVAAWREAEIERVKSTHSTRRVDTIQDKAMCIIALCQSVDSISDLNERVDRLFNDVAKSGSVVLSSTHRAKGSERDRVWLLHDTYPYTWGSSRSDEDEERNLYYVAVTRAINKLHIVHMDRPFGRELDL